jgi:hypothetical protein
MPESLSFSYDEPEELSCSDDEVESEELFSYDDEVEEAPLYNGEVVDLMKEIHMAESGAAKEGLVSGLLDLMADEVSYSQVVDYLKDLDVDTWNIGGAMSSSAAEFVSGENDPMRWEIEDKHILSGVVQRAAIVSGISLDENPEMTIGELLKVTFLLSDNVNAVIRGSELSDIEDFRLGLAEYAEIILIDQGGEVPYEWLGGPEAFGSIGCMRVHDAKIAKINGVIHLAYDRRGSQNPTNFSHAYRHVYWDKSSGLWEDLYE